MDNEKIEKLEEEIKALRSQLVKLEEAMVIWTDGYIKFVEIMQAEYGRKTQTRA